MKAILFSLLLCSTLAACSSASSDYPSLSSISDIGKILTPEEREKAVADMQKIEKTQARDAIKEIEKR